MSEPIPPDQTYSRTTMDAGEEVYGKLSSPLYTGTESQSQSQSQPSAGSRNPNTAPPALTANTPPETSSAGNIAPEEITGNAGDLHLALAALSLESTPAAEPAASTSATPSSSPAKAGRNASPGHEIQTSSRNEIAPPPAPAPPPRPTSTDLRADLPETSGWNEAIERNIFQAGGESHSNPSQTGETRSNFANSANPSAGSTEAADRTSAIDRNTTETQIQLRLNLDGNGAYTVSTGIRFFDHMLELFTRHGGFDLHLKCTGDLDVDQHHTVEDIGIALGEAFDKALGNKKGILRAGYFVMAMDETLAVAAIDLSGRTGYVVDDAVNVPLVGDLQTELLTDFFDGFARGARCNVHVKTMYGRSNHHKVEAIFKAFARALRGAVSRDPRMKDLLPSTKGLL